MLYHHDGKLYEEAASDAERRARAKMEEILGRGRQKARLAMEGIAEEYERRRDILAPAPAIDYRIDPAAATASQIQARVGDRLLNLTDHALGQTLTRMGMPRVYVDRLRRIEAPWAEALLLTSMKKLTDHAVGGDRLLFRVVGDTVKGVLSSAYRRSLDATPIIQVFMEEGLRSGMVPVDGVNTETRYHIKLLQDRLYSPAPHEVIAFGFSLTTSDYGAGALQIQFFMMRLWCTNFAIGENCLREIHIGRRFKPEDEAVLSQRTYDLDTETVASAVRDILSEGIDRRADSVCGLIADANEKRIDVRVALEGFRKRGVMTKEQTRAAETLFENVTDITYLPPERSAWRLSNVLSLMAQNQAGDKKLDLEEAAMELITG